MALDDRLDDREAEAGAARRVARDTMEALEHALALACRNAAAGASMNRLSVTPICTSGPT